MNTDFFQNLALDFPQSAISALLCIILGSLLTNLFGYVKGIIESKDKKIDEMNGKKLDQLIASISTLGTKIDDNYIDLTKKIDDNYIDLQNQIRKQGKKTRKSINGLGNRLQVQLDDHEKRISQTEKQLVSNKS